MISIFGNTDNDINIGRTICTSLQLKYVTAWITSTMVTVNIIVTVKLTLLNSVIPPSKRLLYISSYRDGTLLMAVHTYCFCICLTSLTNLYHTYILLTCNQLSGNGVSKIMMISLHSNRQEVTDFYTHLSVLVTVFCQSLQARAMF